MREQTVADKVKSWSRVAASIGVLLAQPKVRAKMEALLKDRLSSLSEDISDKYDNVANRVEDASDALRGRKQWQGQALSFAVGLGVGAGLGILLAPRSGNATRSAIRGTAVQFKDTVMDSASAVVGKATRDVA